MACLGDLTLAQRSEAQKVESSYAKWWDSVRFRKGWSTPPVSFEQMRPLLTKAAEVVVRVRSALDEGDPTFKMRRVEGCTYAYFADLTPSLLFDPMTVVSGIVHATFKDGDGSYTEGLTEAIVDGYVRQCAQNWESEGTALPRLSPDPEEPRGLAELKAEMAGKLSAAMLSLNELPDDEGMAGSLREALEYLEKGQAILDSLSSQNHTQPPQEPAQTDLDIVEMSDSDTESKRASSPSPCPPFHLDSTLEEEAIGDESPSASESESESEGGEQEESAYGEGSEEGWEHRWVEDMDMKLEGLEELSPTDEEHAPSNTHTPEPEPEAETEPEPEPTPEQIEAKKEFDVKLQGVKAEVERLARAEVVVKEDWRSLDKTAWGAHKAAGRVHRRCLQISEELMKAMLRLDQLSSPCPESRKERKEQVVAIQRQLDSMDATTDEVREGTESLESDHQATVQAKRAEFTALCQRMEAGNFEGLPLEINPELVPEELSKSYTVKCHLEGWPEGTVSASVASVNSHNDTMVVKGSYFPTKQLIREIAQKGVAKIESGEEAALTCTPFELVERVAGARFGTFTKSFTLPNDALWNQGTITFSNGKLLLRLPKDLPWGHGMSWM